MKDLNKDTSFSVSLELLGTIALLLFTMAGMWFSLQVDIAEAKELPRPLDPEVTRVEFDMKDQLVRQTIMSTQEDVTEIKDDIRLIKEKLYE